jgi:hypothetical protein
MSVVHRTSFTNNGRAGRSRSTVYMVGFFAIAAVCLILSLLGSNSKQDDGTINVSGLLLLGSAVHQQEQQHDSSGSTTRSGLDDLPKAPMRIRPIITPTSPTIVAAKEEQEDSNNVAADESDDDGGNLTLLELRALIADLAGNDTRIVRWNAQKHTKQRQRNGACDKLPQALDVLLEEDARWAVFAADYAIWCITDNPTQRAIFSNFRHDNNAKDHHHYDEDDDGHGTVHQAVIDLLRAYAAADGWACANAAHLIYIASFANAKNQQAFFQHGAVEALAKIVMNKQGRKFWNCCFVANCLYDILMMIDD